MRQLTMRCSSANGFWDAVRRRVGRGFGDLEDRELELIKNDAQSSGSLFGSVPSHCLFPAMDTPQLRRCFGVFLAVLFDLRGDLGFTIQRDQKADQADEPQAERKKSKLKQYPALGILKGRILL